MKLLLLLVLSFVSVVYCEFGADSCRRTLGCKCLWSGGRRTADCANAHYAAVPTTLSPDIQALILDGNPLNGLDEDAFKRAGLLNLQTVSLRRCDIRRIDANAFRDLKIVRSVDLSYNNITELHPKTFDGNEGLTKLVLRGNRRLEELQQYQFPPLNSLKVTNANDTKRVFGHF